MNRKTVTKGPATNIKASKINQRPPTQTKPETDQSDELDRDATIIRSGEERVVVTHNLEDVEGEDKKKVEEEEKEEQTKSVEESEREKEEEFSKKEGRPKYERGSEYKKSNITPENFNVKEFNTNLTEFIRTLDDPRYSTVDEDYPVDELVKVVDMVSTSVKDYRNHAHNATVQLEDLREAMRNIKENLHFSVSRQAMDLRAESDHQSQEEKDLLAKLTKLNADIAKANADVTEAIRLATETESTAVRADITAEKGRQEARRLQEEIENREKIETQRREEERKKMEEVKRKKAEEEKRAEEESRRKEEEWKRRETLQNDKSKNVYDNWEPQTYQFTNENGETEVTCIARGQPRSFNRNDLRIEVASDKEATLTYLPHEELISNVVDLKPTNGNEELKEPIYVAIPHVMSRSSAASREAVVKAMMDGEWIDLPTQDVTFDTHKETKFAQAEVRHLTTLVVMSRIKRDYATLNQKIPHKLTSSCDQRVTLTIEKDTFSEREHFMMQVQPIDSGIFQEFRTRHPNGKTLLTCSPIVHTQWEASTFMKPVLVTVPCPPNPAKARKMALARRLKEEKMKQPVKVAVQVPTMNQEKDEAKEKQEKEKKRLQQYESPESEAVVTKPTKWYMGEYANSDDDETDRFFFAYQAGKKWRVESDLDIKQVKVDLLSFYLQHPVEKFIILRTRTSVDEDSALALALGLDEHLSKRFVEAVVRQRTENPFEVVLQITPVTKRDAVVTNLAQKGFESGPAPSHVLCLHEGDVIEVGFSGNIESDNNNHSSDTSGSDGGDGRRGSGPEQLIFKSNVPTMTYFTVKEENKFRQKDHDVFSGLLVLTRKYVDHGKTSAAAATFKRLQSQSHIQVHTGGHDGTDDLGSHHLDSHVIPEKEWKRERLCALQINIPKYHIEPNTVPKRAPVAISEATGTVDRDLLQFVSDQLGDEWRKLAHYLGVHRARVQAIIRNVMVGDKEEKEAKYEMLMTWLKSAPKSADKISILSSALQHCDRLDLAEAIKSWGQHGDDEIGSGRLKSASRSRKGSAGGFRTTQEVARSPQTMTVH